MAKLILMKAISFLPVFIWAGFFYQPDLSGHLIYKIPVADSSPITHKLDGVVKEWPPAKFTTDEGTGIQYAIDNDGQNLYMAMNIAEGRMQLKMMRTGMSTYIDIKGKKKESRGVEFPEKNETAESSLMGTSGPKSSQQENGQPKKPDMKAIRMTMALGLVDLKLFGFTKDEAADQQLMLPNSVNIAFAWDSADVMHIEYLVPLSLLADIPELDQKEISIGWNIHAFEMPKREGGAEPSGMGMGGYGGRGGGYGGGGGHRGYRGGGGGGNTPEDMQRMMQAQKIWAKYTIVVPVAKKAF